jgi:hypothetical protein
MIELYQTDYAADHAGATDPNMIPSSLNKADSEAAHKAQTYPSSYWNSKIRGQAYVIRPDEPTRK